MKNYKKNRNNTPIIITISVILLLLLGAGVVYAWNASNNNQKSDIDKSSGINYEPPTEDEVRASQDGKKNSQRETDLNPPENNKKTVSVGIAFAGYDSDEKAIDIRAFTPDVIEGDGTCTAVLTQGSYKVSKKAQAFIDSSSSQCQPILIPEVEFPVKGTWLLTVSYSSDKSSGSSPVMNLGVSE